MHKLVFTALASAGAIALPTAAHAQADTASTQGPEVYVGASAGIHNFDLGLPTDDSGIYGVVAGVDFPIGDRFFVGAEGNFHFGDGAVDNEYGIAARAGVRVGNTGKVFLRGGYQEVDFDLNHIFGLTVPPGTDTSGGDYLLGAGAEVGLGDSPVRLRAGIDTIAFDSTRATVGLIYAF